MCADVFQDLQTLVRSIDPDRNDNKFFFKDELRTQHKGKAVVFQDQEENIKAMEDKLKNQEKRSQEKTRALEI
jgi:DNA polymerase III epsilon subunit-like protein